ncbi:MAG: ATP-dependent DNA ligase [Nitriliruptoraceae bacterium]|nr:ATP-dependent DNA ligase [Nitriliruptoraceae bacterium]
MRLADLVAVSEAVASTRARTRKIALLTDALSALPTDERIIGVAYLAGEPRQDRLDLGPAAVGGVDVAPAATPSLTLRAVDAALQAIADVPVGSGSRARRIEHLGHLLARATAEEQSWLRRLVLRELRQGALEGVLVPAIAAAADVEVADVRRAVMRLGDLRVTATQAFDGGTPALRAVRLAVGRAVQPMLASTAEDVAAALAGLNAAVVEEKFDGVRLQVHRDGEAVRVFTRNLHDVTHRVPEIVAAARALDVDRVVLDAEAIALDADGRPRPFQETMQRFGRERDVAAVQAEVPLELRVFDVLHLDGDDLLDAPLATRRAALERHVPAASRVASTVTTDLDEARAFVAQVLRDGHEGAMVKDLAAPYEAGRRGASWRKCKPVHTLDLLVIAAEWGSGRRKGWLSNLHLACRDEDESDTPVMLGKTFKGLTDEVLTWQTDALLAREVRRDGHVVYVRPDLVVEIAFDGLVRSSRYPGGLALRFARVRGYRQDKPAAEADTVASVRAIHARERLPAL